jgi:anti-sigma regulatory factor (Ser/Thr protein kinase)
VPPAGRSPIAPGSLLLLYTDGLIERRAESLDVGFARLADAAAGCARLPAGTACTRLLARMAGDHGYDDDVALVAVRPVGTTATSHVDALYASFTELAPARNRLRAWLNDLRIPSAQAYGIVLSTGEALSNAIEHGSDLDPDRTVGLEAFASQHEITVTVSDTGHWTKDSAAASRPANRGRGLKLIGGFSDDVQIVRTARGTRVTMTYRIG